MDDGADYSGSKTPVFTILSLDDKDVEVYCEVSALVYGQPATITSNTAGIGTTEMKNLQLSNINLDFEFDFFDPKFILTADIQ